MKKVIAAKQAPNAAFPYSPGIRVGNTVYISGQIPIDPETGEMGDTIEEQAAQALTNLQNVLKLENLGMENVVKTTVFITDINDFPKVNEIYSTFFEPPFPARSCIEISKIPKGCKIEIECIAYAE